MERSSFIASATCRLTVNGEMEGGIFQELLSSLLAEYNRICAQNDELRSKLRGFESEGSHQNMSEAPESTLCSSQPPPSEPLPPSSEPPTLPLLNTRNGEDAITELPRSLQEPIAIQEPRACEQVSDEKPKAMVVTPLVEQTPPLEQNWLAVGVPGEVPPETTLSAIASLATGAPTYSSQETLKTVSDSRMSCKSNVEEFDPTRPYSWQWQHRTGFRNYDRNATKRIEEAYQKGESKARLKTGKKGTTPMEIFFADMVQFDPSSKNTRVIRRVGPDNIWSRFRRTVNSYIRYFETGQPRYESCANYQIRRHALTASQISLSTPQRKNRSSGRNTITLNPNASKCSRWCRHLAHSSSFSILSPLLVFMNSIWISIDIDRNNYHLLYDADIRIQIIEQTFCALFVFDITARWYSYFSYIEAFKDRWFCFDMFLVFLMVLETEILPPILVLSHADDDVIESCDKFMARLRVLRLLRLTRFVRLMRVGDGLTTLLKGIAHAMRSVFLTMVLLFLLLYFFGVIFRVEAKDEDQFRSKFPSVVGSMVSLLFYGTFLDSPRLLMEDLEGYIVLQFFFLVFIFFSCFTLINMLVGILCQVAFEVSKAAKAETEKSYLQKNLSGILECYDKDEENTLGVEEFSLLMENPEVHEILVKFGTDPWLLRSLKEKLFPEQFVMIDFAHLFQVISRLRGNHTAHVTDIVELREFIKAELMAMRSELFKISSWTSDHDDIGTPASRKAS